MKAKLDNLTINFGKRKIVLTEEEAKALRDELNKLFGGVPNEIHHHHETVRERHVPRWDRWPDIICKSEQTDGLKMLSGRQ